MHRGHRIVCVTPDVRRRRSLELLAAYVLAEPLVDTWVVGVAADGFDDPAWLDELATSDPRVSLLPPLVECDAGGEPLAPLYRRCIDPDAVYVRLDEDVCYLEDGFFAGFLDFRLAQPDLFLVYPFVVNSPFCTYLMQVWGRTRLSHGRAFGPGVEDQLGAHDGGIAQRLHTAFLDALASGDLSFVRVPPRVLSGALVPATCSSWLGRCFAEFGGEVPLREGVDAWLSMTKPLELDLFNCLWSERVAVRFANPGQRAWLEQNTDLHACYADLARAASVRGSTVVDEGIVYPPVRR